MSALRRVAIGRGRRRAAGPERVGHDGEPGRMRLRDQRRARLDQLPRRADRGGEGLRLAQARRRSASGRACRVADEQRARHRRQQRRQPADALLLERLQVDGGPAFDLRADEAVLRQHVGDRLLDVDAARVEAGRRLQLREDAGPALDQRDRLLEGRDRARRRISRRTTTRRRAS